MAGYTIELAHGPRSAEELALARIRSLRREAADGGSPLASPPLLIVVPSRSLRVHLLRRLAEGGGPEVAVGVRCATAYGVACELTDTPAVALADPVAALAERFARGEPQLAALGDLTDGFGLVAAAIRDLLDAGFEPPHLDGLLEALDQPEARAAGNATRERAAALLRVAARVERACEEHDLPARHRVYRRAAEAILRGNGPRLQAVVVHGFAEATGVVSELLQALLRTHGGHLLIDRPRDPFTPDGLAGDGKFSQRLLERVQGASSRVSDEARGDSLPRLRLMEAARPAAEVEEVAHHILDLLAEGHPAEEIGVVMRDPQAYRLLLRRRFDALGVPFSTSGIDGAGLPFRRRITCLLDLLEEAERLPVERWLELLPPSSGTSAPDLALALAARGAGRLAATAEVSAAELRGEAPIPLPIRRLRTIEAADVGESDPSLDEPADESAASGDTGERHPTIPRADLRRAVDKARATLDSLARLRDTLPLREHLEILRRFLDHTLEWPREDPARREIEDRVFAPAAALPADWRLGYAEFRRLLAGLLADAGRQPLGGAGAGVQVLDVVAARARTFEHLFVLGMQRGRFPRQVGEDPLLPDEIRDVLATHGAGPLPELPRKRTGHDEEAHLFAQLLTAAPEVALSWSTSNADGAKLSPSPWIERLRATSNPETLEAATAWADPASGGDSSGRRLVRRSADEWLRLAGQHGSRADVGRLLHHAVAAALPVLPGLAPAVARTRLAILDELDPELGSVSRRRLGPYSGLVGTPAGGPEIWVTGLEGMARCPWQHFLRRWLRLEAWPDPLTDLPALDALVLGSFVHAVLEEVAARAGATVGAAIADAVAGAPVEIPWPPAEELERIASEVAARVLAREGIHLAGVAAGLIALGRPLLDNARALLWGRGSLTVAGAEVEGAVELDGERIRFRADLAVREEEGIRLIDFKTGKPLSQAAKPDTRYRHLLDAVERGDALQVPAYAATRLDVPVSSGEYRYLTDLDLGAEGSRTFTVPADGEEARSRLLLAVGRLLKARRLGVFPPRLNEPGPGRQETPGTCKSCEVRQACLQDESTARIRQRVWVDDHQRPETIADARERVFAELWWMRDPKWSSRLQETDA